MTIQEILEKLGDKESSPVDVFRRRSTPLPDIEKIKKEYNPKEHLIFDKAKRPDKPIYKENDLGEKELERYEYVARIALALQKLIVRRSASFLFGNRVAIDSDLTEDDEAYQIVNALKKVLRENKDLSLNKKIARELFRSTEVAEFWYPVEKKNNTYGFDSDFRLRVSIFSPFNGDKLYPIFDETGDMIAFSREYEVKDGDESVSYFVTYTADEIIKWEKKDGKWEEKDRTENILNKIPIVYARQEQTEWDDVQGLIERLEKLISNYADTIDYHSSPTIFVKGVITGFAKKGESGKILQSSENADAKYLSWDQAPDAVKLEIENDLRMIFTLTQTPDISFEAVKGIGNISGVALKLMFLDAHLKVEDKKEIFVEYLERRFNIIKTYVSKFSKSMEKYLNVEVEPEITPYMLDDERTLIDNISTALGGKAFISRKTAIRTLSWVDNVDEEISEIENEEIGGLEQ